MNKQKAITRLRQCRKEAFAAGQTAGMKDGEVAVSNHLDTTSIIRIIAIDADECPGCVGDAVREVLNDNDLVYDATYFEGLDDEAFQSSDAAAYLEGFYLGFHDGVERAWESIAEQVVA